jgi:serine/threonine protein kinase
MARRCWQVAVLAQLILLPSLALAAARHAPQGAVRWNPRMREHGGFGRVFEGTDRAGRHYAKKVVRDRDVAAHEVQVLERINGDSGWPELYSARERWGRIELVMDWLGGPTLWDRAPVSGRQAIRLGQRLLERVAALHEKGLIHQDIKPEHVVVEGRSARLLDLGMACELGGRWDGMSGTPEYRAPEQKGPGVRTPATDTFAVAATMLFLLSREHPYPEVRDLSTRSPRLREQYEERAAVRKVADPALRAVLRKALHPDPKRRYRTARGFWRALERLRHRTAA